MTIFYLLFSLNSRLEEWGQVLNDLPMCEMLLNTVIIASAFLTYCGAIPTRSLLVHVVDYNYYLLYYL